MNLKTLLATAVVGTVFFSGPAIADEADCRRIALPPFTGMADKAGDDAAKLGYVSVEGTIFANGKKTCIAAHIECAKTDNLCHIILVIVDDKLGKYPRIFAIMPSGDIEIKSWTDNEIVAEGQSALCARTQLFINYPAHTVRMIRTATGCGANRSPPQTEVFDIESDPAYFEARQ